MSTVIVGESTWNGLLTRPRGFDNHRSAMWFIAIAMLLQSAPQALNFARLLPVEGVLLVVALHLVSRSQRSIVSARVPLIAILLLIWFGLSAFWSDGAGITLVQTISTGLAMAIGVIAGTFSTFRALVHGVALGGLVVLGLSLVVAVADPAAGLTQDAYQYGTLQGIYVHRNILAGVLTVSFAAALACVPQGRHPRLLWFITAGALLAGVLSTASSTSVASCLGVSIVAAFLWLTRRLTQRWRLLALLGSLGTVIALAAVALLNQAAVFAFLQRDDTLTGRTLIWEAVGNLIDVRPLIGYGWGATWSPGFYVESYVSAYAKFVVPSAHDGYLDTWVQIGLVGLVLIGALMLIVVFRGAGAVLTSDSRLVSFPVLLVGALAVHNISETNIVDSSVLFILVAVLARMLVRRRTPDATVDQVIDEIREPVRG